MRKPAVIKNAAPPDASELASIQIDCRTTLDLKFGLELGNLFPDRTCLERIWIARMQRTKAKIYCLREKDSGPIIGFCQTGACEGGELHINALYVRPAFWRKGYGTELVKKIFFEARDAGVRSIRLEVLAQNSVAKNFYLKFGFSFATSGERIVRAGEKYFQFKRMIYRI